MRQRLCRALLGCFAVGCLMAGTSSAGPVLAAEQADAALTGQLAFAQCEDYINIRERADTDSRVTAKIYNNGAVTIEDETDGWYKVRSGNAEGYVKAEYFATGKEAEAIAEKAAYRVAAVHPESLNVRSASTEDGSLVTVAHQGDELEVVAWDGDWMKVALGGDVYGYVNAYYVDYKVYYPEAETLEEEAARLAAEKKAAELWEDQTADAAQEGSGTESGGTEAFCTEPESSETEAPYTEPEYSETEAPYTEPEYSETEAPYTEPEYSETEAPYTEPEYSETEPVYTEPEYSETEPVYTEPEYSETEAPYTEPEYSETEAPYTEPEYSETEAPYTEPEYSETEAPYTEPEYSETEAPYTEPEYSETEASYTEPEYSETEPVYTEPEYSETEATYTEPEYSETEATSSGTGQQIADFAVQYVGYPYVWGGTSLTGGADCSGFTQSVFANFGIGLSRTAESQSYGGTSVGLDSVQPGDLLFYNFTGSIDHVAIYIGGGQIVHAANSQKGIITSDMYYSSPVCARRYW